MGIISDVASIMIPLDLHPNDKSSGKLIERRRNRAAEFDSLNEVKNAPDTRHREEDGESPQKVRRSRLGS